MARYPDRVDLWRAAGRIAAEARELGLRLARPGLRRRELAEAIESLVRARGAQPAFPANLSRNWEAAHFTPGVDDDAELREGDLLKIDVGAHLDGAIADTAMTIEVGGTHRFENMIRAAREGLAAGVAAVRASGTVDAISVAVERAIHARGLKPIQDLTGHSIERYLLHAGKSIPNVGGSSAARTEEGEVLAIEPFVTNGAGHIENGDFGNIVRFRTDPGDRDPALASLFARFRTLPFTARWIASPDDLRALKRHRRLLQMYPVFVEAAQGWVAQAEHTILVGPDGAEVLTAP
jgi:methionyl aminopeptidase